MKKSDIRAIVLLEEDNKRLRVDLRQYVSGHGQLWAENKKLREENRRLKGKRNALDGVNT